MARVPQFGEWENGEHVPYTGIFDSARAGRGGGKLINPNDPQHNPSVLSGGRGNRFNPNDPQQNPSAFSHGRGRANHVPQHEKKPTPQGSPFHAPPTTPGRSAYTTSGRSGATQGKGVALPKFGDWDDPAGAPPGGYTMIFTKAREERTGGNATDEMQFGNGNIHGTPTLNAPYNNRGTKKNKQTKCCIL